MFRREEANGDSFTYQDHTATPDFIATDLNEFKGTRTVREGARIVIELATLEDAGPTGGIFNDAGPLRIEARLECCGDAYPKKVLAALR
jgi:hypothetical protein